MLNCFQNIYFNTSNVKVQHTETSLWNISVNDFNTSNVKVQRINDFLKEIQRIKFQYIQCEGSAYIRCTQQNCLWISIHPMWRFSQVEHHLCYLEVVNFNTSNVKVQQTLSLVNGNININFNTSNVKVQQSHLFHLPSPLSNFNTSNVKVQQELFDRNNLREAYFNTSNVKVQL